MLPVLSWFCLLSSVCRIPCRIFCSGGLVVTYCFSFCISWKTFIPPSILNDTFAGYSILGLKFLSFSSQNVSLHALLVFKVSVKKCGVIVIGLPLYVICFFSLTGFNILLFSVMFVLMIICCGEALFRSSLFGVLEVSCT
jgi:hypothetical protein